MIDDDILADFDNRTKPKTNGEFNSRLEQAKNAYKEKFGKDLPITSTLRNRKEQQDLYNRFKKEEKGIYMPLNPADYPNQKIFHTDAADISTEVPETFLNQYGLHRPLGKNDPVHTVLNPNFKSSNFTNVSNTSEDLLNQFEQDRQQHEQYLKNEGLYQPKNEWKPGFYNPNLVRQGEAARRAGGGNLQPIVEGVTDALKSMSLEDWKKESTLANMLKYGVGQMPIVGDQGFHEEGKNKLIESGKSAINALMNPKETYEAISQQEPGQLLGQMVKGAIYDAPLGPSAKPIMNVAGAVAKPVISATGEVLKPVAEGFGTLQESFANAKKAMNPTVSIDEFDIPKQMTGVGAANVNKKSAIANLIPNLSPETQTFINSHPSEKINLPALETKALEEKHGIPLTKGQREGSSRYAEEWNHRDENKQTQDFFSNQPRKFREAFEKLFDKHSSDIGELSKENIGQLQIDALAKKDASRISAINQAKQDLVDANGGQFPIDITTLKSNIDAELSRQLKSRHLSDAIKGDLEDFYQNPTFESFEYLRSNLADEMRSAKDGKSRQAAWIARDQLEKLPVFGEEGGNAQARILKGLADKYRALNVERYNVIKTNPAYKAAIKEASDAKEAASMESLNASKFHDKYITNATPESVRRMIDEIKDNPEALKAIKAGDLLNARDALVPNEATPQLRAEMFNKYLRNQSSKTKYVHDAESAQDLIDLAVLSSKVAQPKDKVFNYSNSLSGLFGDLARQGLQIKGESALAALTHGASVPALAIAKPVLDKLNKNKFHQETIHPHSGLLEENK